MLIGSFPKSTKIIETTEKQLIPLSHMTAHSWLSTGTSIKSGGVKLVLLT
jgi:hypothetical protein